MEKLRLKRRRGGEGGGVPMTAERLRGDGSVWINTDVPPEILRSNLVPRLCIKMGDSKSERI